MCQKIVLHKMDKQCKNCIDANGQKKVHVIYSKTRFEINHNTKNDFLRIVWKYLTIHHSQVSSFKIAGELNIKYYASCHV